MLMLLGVSGFAQTFTNFTTFYVEDARGNRDSAQIVWHSVASSFEVFTEKGEENLLNVPFDSILEVRFSNGIAYDGPVTKNNKRYFCGIEEGNKPLDPHCDHLYGDANLLVHAKYPPVTVSWDTSFFAVDNCFRGSAMVNHDIWIEFGTDVSEWEDRGEGRIETYCMLEDGFFMTDLLPKWDNSGGWSKFAYDFALNNGDTARHGVHALLIETAIVPTCSFKVLTSEESLIEEKITIHPNPVKDMITLDSRLIGSDFQISDIHARPVISGVISSTIVDLSEIPAGVYFMRIKGADARGSTRFVKL